MEPCIPAVATAGKRAVGFRLLPLLPPPQPSTPLNAGPPPPSSLSIPAACPTPAYSRIPASTSPNSIRYPRSFTCSSRLPKNSNSRFLLHRPMSPVRYSRLPASPYGLGTNRPAVNPRLPQISSRQSRPSDVQLSHRSHWHCFHLFVVFAIGRPIGTQSWPLSHRD